MNHTVLLAPKPSFYITSNSNRHHAHPKENTTPSRASTDDQDEDMSKVRKFVEVPKTIRVCRVVFVFFANAAERFQPERGKYR
jgi:hypothetical protein